VQELVKKIEVQPMEIDGKTIPSVTITYRFNEPCQEIAPIPSAVVLDHKPVLVDIMVIRKNRVPVRLQR
jgi:hypothetical protein